MKEDGKMHFKSTIYESTLSTADAVPLSLEGKVPRRGGIGHRRYERQMRKVERCAAQPPPYL